MKNGKAPYGYKVTAVGVIPEEWDVKCLNSLGYFLRGRGVSKNELIDDGLPCLTYGELYTSHHNVIRKFTSFISGQSADQSVELEQGDILFAGSGETLEEIGKSAAFVDPFKAYAGGDIIILRQRTQDPHFLGYLLNYETVNRQIHKLGQGHSVVHIYPSGLQKIKIPLPPLPEQQKIAAILSTWDEAIEKTQSLIDQIRQRNKGLAQQLLTGKKRLKGFSAEWREMRADKIFKNHSDKSHNGQLEVLSATQEEGVVPRSTVNIDIKFDENSLDTYKKVEVGDFVISLRSFQGGIEYSAYEGLISPAYTVLKEIVPISKTFFKVYFKTETFISLLNTIIYGIRDGKQISYKEFATLKLPYPDTQEQSAIAQVLEHATRELKLYERKLNALKKQKKGLMQKLLTGEIRVTTNVI